MTDATTEQTTPDLTPQAPPAAPASPNPPEAAKASGDAANQKTFTEAEFNAMLTSRLSKHEKSIRKQIEDEQAEAKRQADLSADERAKEAERKANERIAEIEAQLKQADLKVALAGKVTNVDRVIRLMDDPDKYVKDGVVDDKALQRDFSEYIPKQAAPPPDNSPDRGEGASIDDLIRRKIRGV